MPTTDFVDALHAAYASRVTSNKLLKAVPVLTVRELLGAVMLDDTGISPSDLLSGTTVLVHDDVDVCDTVCEALRRLWWDGLTIMQQGSSSIQYDASVSSGTPIVIVTTDRLSFHPHDAVLLADRDFDLGEVGRPSIVASLTRAVTGVAVDIAASDAARLGASSLLRCVHLLSTADDCTRRLRTWLDDAGWQEAKSDEVSEVAKPAVDPKADRHKTNSVVRRLSEMTGFGEASTWGCNLAADLRDYSAGRLAWSDVDRGVLLSGPPGGGKTTFARALALECDVDLVTTVYSDWHQGHGDAVARTLNKLFADWRKKAQDGPFIVFVDELDSIGVRGGNAQNDAWYSSIINAWLAFLDGAIPRDGIVVVAATNLPERIDKALLRPGRLDRHIALPMPDISALEGMVRAHLGPDAVIDERELAEAARAVRGRSPAEVQQLAREARRIARWCGRRVCASDLTEAVALQRLDADPIEDRVIAVHEAGHAVAACVTGVDRLNYVDVDRAVTSMRMGAHWDEATVHGRLLMMLAARAAEEVICGRTTTGAGQDLIDATNLATCLHTMWGWGVSGLASMSRGAAAADARVAEAVRTTLDAAYARALEFVRAHRPAIERVAEALIARRYLDAGEVSALVAGVVSTDTPVRGTAPTIGGRPRRVVGPRSPPS